MVKGIRALARHLDLSISTVSKALNGRWDINEETRKRVLETAAELGYVANQSGRALRQGSTNTVGFMIETNLAASTDYDPFFMEVLNGVQRVLRRHHLDDVARRQIVVGEGREDAARHLLDADAQPSLAQARTDRIGAAHILAADRRAQRQVLARLVAESFAQRLGHVEGDAHRIRRLAGDIGNRKFVELRGHGKRPFS